MHLPGPSCQNNVIIHLVKLNFFSLNLLRWKYFHYIRVYERENILKHFEIFTFNLVCSFPHCDQLSRGSLPGDSGTKIFVVRITFTWADVILVCKCYREYCSGNWFYYSKILLPWESSSFAVELDTSTLRNRDVTAGLIILYLGRNHHLQVSNLDKNTSISMIMRVTILTWLLTGVELTWHMYGPRSLVWTLRRVSVQVSWWKIFDCLWGNYLTAPCHCEWCPVCRCLWWHDREWRE